MQNYRFVFAPLLLAALSACSTYVPPAGKPTATLTMYIENDSANTRSRMGMASIYADDECARSPTGTAISRNMSMDERDELPAKQIVAEQPVTFALWTIDVLWSGNAGCSVTATFTPVANQTYDARLYTRNNAGRCSMVIVDKDNHEVPSTRPEYSCSGGMNGITKNGIGWFKPTNYLFAPPNQQ